MSDEKPRGEFLGSPVDGLTMQGTVDRCLAWCKAPRRSQVLITINAMLLVMMRSDPKLREACVSGDAIVVDGVPVWWAARALGNPLPARVAGVDLMGELLAAADEHALRVYFLGAKQEVIDTLLEIVRREHPGAVVAGARNGYFDAGEHDEIVAAIRESQADILFIGMPTPFKETWCHEHKDALDTPVIIGVGGSFDVVAGYTQRAPVWMQKIGMEWFWRFLMEPGRMWKRYLVTNSIFIWMFLKALVARALGAGRPKSAASS